MAITQQSMTLEAFLELAEEKPALELIDGVVRQKVSPDFLHGILQSKTMEFINQFAEQRELAIALTEVRTTFAGHSPIPDVSVYLWDRAPVEGDGSYGRFPRGNQPLPDIAIEIRSPDETVREQVEKCNWYVANGVTIALMLDADARAVWDCRPGTEPRRLGGSDVVDLGDVIPDFRFTVDELFSRFRRRKGR